MLRSRHMLILVVIVTAATTAATTDKTLFQRLSECGAACEIVLSVSTNATLNIHFVLQYRYK
jgi:hypothetical protein